MKQKIVISSGGLFSAITAETRRMKDIIPQSSFDANPIIQRIVTVESRQQRRARERDEAKKKK